jgi:hypothetical protein
MSRNDDSLEVINVDEVIVVKKEYTEEEKTAALAVFEERKNVM